MDECVDLTSPASRREALRRIDVDDPRPDQALLREIFDLERTWREGPDDDEYEQIYLTAFLLFLIGDPGPLRGHVPNPGHGPGKRL